LAGYRQRWRSVLVDYSDEATLVDALRRRDDRAFAWLLDQYNGSLRRVAMSFVPSRAVADEVVQETWLGVVRGIDGFEGRSSVKTWIYRILMNVGRTRGERERRTVPFADAFADDAPSFAPERFRTPPAPYPGHWSNPPAPWDEQPADRLMSSETLAIVRRAIDRLPLGQQTVMRLRDIEGWTSSEVCELLELTEANQRVLLHRGRARVRQVLEDYFEGPDA
jgi:RNA polymerase sigma-70 factor (ECF subfamily)